MFVDIVSPKKPLEAEKLFRACWRGKEEITVEIATEVLKSTNFATCMKRMLLCVERLPQEKQAAFREVVLSVFDRREQPESVIEIGERLALNGGYEKDLAAVYDRLNADDFDAVYDEEEVFLSSSPNREVYEVFRDEYCTAYELADCQAAVFLSPKVEFDKKTALPKKTNMVRCDEVIAEECDLSGCKLKFKAGAKLNLHGAKNLPEDLDVSEASAVDLGGCDLSPVKNLKFKDGAKVNLAVAQNLPEDLDVSQCCSVDLQFCDLGGVKALRFQKGAEVNLMYAKNFPEELDLSECKEAVISWCDLSTVKYLKLYGGGKVNLTGAKLPETLDVSECDELDVTWTAGAQVKKWIFQSREQQQKLGIEFNPDYKSEIVYIDEEKGRKPLSLPFIRATVKAR